MLKQSLSTACALAAALLTGCAEEAPVTLTPAAPEQVVATLVSGLAAPGFERVAQQSQVLEASVDALCTSPDEEQLSTARADWTKLNAAWRAQYPWMFGPARDLTIRRSIDLWPTYEVVLRAALEPDAEAYTRKEPNARGIAAAEMLLFGDGKFPATSSQWQDATRCAHLRDINAEITRLTGDVAERWRQDYASMMIEGDAMAVVNLVVAEILNSTESMLWQRLGLPANFFRGNPKPEQLEAWRSGQSLAGIKSSLQTIAKIISGMDESPGIASLLVAEEPAQAEALVRASQDALAKADGIEPPLSDALENSNTEALFNAVQDLKNELLASADLLGLTIEFESDGD